MQTAAKNNLFTDLSAQEASTINGASRWGYYYPVYYCYPVSSWGGSGGSSVNQTVNVTVKIDD